MKDPLSIEVNNPEGTIFLLFLIPREYKEYSKLLHQGSDPWDAILKIPCIGVTKSSLGSITHIAIFN